MLKTCSKLYLISVYDNEGSDDYHRMIVEAFNIFPILDFIKNIYPYAYRTAKYKIYEMGDNFK